MNNMRQYALRREERTILRHGPEAFEGMRRAGRLAAETLDMITPHVQPGVATGELDLLCDTFIRDHGAISAPLGYRGFPKSICTSINHVVCHGIPGDKRLLPGDIVNIDVTPILDGWYGDSSRMYAAGDISVKAQRLIDVTFEAMWAGIRAVRPGATLAMVGHAIQVCAEAARFSVVRDFCGHGLGRVFHTAPNVLHYTELDPEDVGTSRDHSLVLEPGMFFTIEPMINAGRFDVKIKPDGWTAVTKDHSLSAQFEHSIGVTDDSCEVFTPSPAGLDRPPYAIEA